MWTACLFKNGSNGAGVQTGVVFVKNVKASKACPFLPFHAWFTTSMAIQCARKNDLEAYILGMRGGDPGKFIGGRPSFHIP